MKKHKRKIIAAVAAVLCLWAAVFFTDYVCVSKVSEPVFAKPSAASADNGGNTEYRGLGYTVDIEYLQSAEHGEQIEQITMYGIFGNVINAVIACY